MKVSGKELEQQLRDVGKRLLSLPSAVNEVLKILHQTEILLLKVDQSPTKSMLDSLRPVMNALISKELLSYSDVDLKVAVVSCISELTRITAPDGPYDEDTMKEVFRWIVETFEKLDDLSSQSFSRRVGILDTLATVRSCVVMLDLECDDLILEMFSHFINKIRPTHAYHVFSSMETIMTVVLEESEDISADLLSCLLETVNLDKKNILPVARELGEKVIRNCANQLEPYLKEFFQSKHSSLKKYNSIVRDICKKKTVASEQNDINVDDETMEDEGRLSDRTVSDDCPQESAKLKDDVGFQEDLVGTRERSKKPSMDNTSSQVQDDESFKSSIRVTPSGKEELKITSKAENGCSKISRPSHVGTSDTSRAKRVHSPGGKLTKLHASCQKELPDNGNSEVKSQSQTSKKCYTNKCSQGESLNKNQSSTVNQLKKHKSAEVLDEKLIMKEEVSTIKIAKNSPKDLGNSKGTPTSTAGTKHGPTAKDLSEETYSKGALDGSLVGAKVKIWWPDDEEYYDGVVESYDPCTKKHKILYTDGDIEILRLSKERWLLIDEVKKRDSVGMKRMSSLDATAKELHPKKVKVTSSSLQKTTNEDTPTKSDRGNGSTGGIDLPKRKGRPPKVRDSILDHSPSDRDATSSKLNDNEASRSCDKNSKSSAELKMAATFKLEDKPKVDKSAVDTVMDLKELSEKPERKPSVETVKSDNKSEADNAAIKGKKGVLETKPSEYSSATSGNSNVINTPKPDSELDIIGPSGKEKSKVQEANFASKLHQDASLEAEQ